MNHDALGRRTAEYDDFDATRSRREYTYLPNGQLGSISGQTWTGTPYSTQVRYDERGRPITISASDLFELYWDDHDRLIAASIIFPGARGAAGYVAARWHYHWLGRRLLATTRELIDEAENVDVKRFWAVSDERGFVYRLLDEQAATYWQARWDSTGWRTFVGTPQQEMWVPFALPGQVLLGRSRIGMFTGAGWSEGTEAFASGSGGTWSRPPVALNQWRAYDAREGAFIQPDTVDHLGVLIPEGYSYAGNAPSVDTDMTGLSTNNGCDEGKMQTIRTAVNAAIMDVDTCVGGLCGKPGGRSIRRAWRNSLINLDRFVCLADPKTESAVAFNATFGYWVDPEGLGAVYELKTGKPLGFAVTELKKSRVVLSLPYSPVHLCLKAVIAHEALHLANYKTPMGYLFRKHRAEFPWYYQRKTIMQWGEGLYDEPRYGNKEERWVQETVDECVKCPSFGNIRPPGIL